MWRDGVIPVAVERGGFELHGGQFGICDLDPGWVGTRVQSRLDLQSSTRGGVADEVDDHLQADEWPAAPVLRDVAEQAVLDHVPLAGARRQVAHAEAESSFVGQSLELGLPEASMAAIAAATVGTDQHLGGARVAGAAHLLPP